MHRAFDFSVVKLTLVVLFVSACRQTPPPAYVRLDGASPPVEHLPAARAHLLVFWASWCEPCRKETPELRALAADPPTGSAVVVFSHDEHLNDVVAFFGGEPDPTLHLRLDRGRETARSFGVETLPASILTVEGRLVARFSGPQEWNSRATRGLLGKLIEETGSNSKGREPSAPKFDTP